jgi:serine/threonine-protein kinase
MNPQRKRREVHPVIFYSLVVIGAFLFGVLIFYYIIMPGLVGRGDVTIVPGLEGLSLALAEEKCGDGGLELTVVGERHSDDIPQGYIIEQDPEPEEKLKEGRVIRVIVSAGRRMEFVPELRNKSLRQAELLLESSGLRKGRIVRIFSPLDGQNNIVSTFPPAGESVPHGSRIDILICMRGEPRKYHMPNLIGMDLPFVRDRLAKLGFQIGRVVSRRVSDKFPNTILDQHPEPGSCIEEGETIELVVSTVE